MCQTLRSLTISFSSVYMEVLNHLFTITTFLEHDLTHFHLKQLTTTGCTSIVWIIWTNH